MRVGQGDKGKKGKGTREARAPEDVLPAGGVSVPHMWVSVQDDSLRQDFQNRGAARLRGWRPATVTAVWEGGGKRRNGPRLWAGSGPRGRGR